MFLLKNEYMDRNNLMDKLKPTTRQLTNKAASNLHKDEPADLLPLVASIPVNGEISNKNTVVDPKTKPFFLYQRDGLYGLL